MRPKIALIILGFGVLAIVGLSLLRQQSPSGNQSQINVASSVATSRADSQMAEAAKSNVAKTNAVDPKQADVLAAHAVGASPSNSIVQAAPGRDPGLSKEEYVEKRVGELMDLGMSDDPQALKTILSELKNSEPEIRKAAIEASKQFGSTDAIPALQEAMSNQDLAEDRQDLREAIEFLKLPSFLAKKN